MLESKLSNVGTTIFTEISALAARHKAINLGQGFPDYDGPELLRERLAYHCIHGANQYSPMIGVEKLRQQIALKVERLYQNSLNPETEITVVPGATEAIYCAITATVRPGDEVIVFDPAYDSYVPAIELCGGRSVHIPLLPPDFAIDWQRVRDAISPRTRMLILNSPHNPTGSIITADDIQALHELVERHDLILLSDEVYEHLVFDDAQHLSLLRYPELYQRAFVVSSFGKTFHVTGWKTGYCVAPPELSSELRKVHQFVAFVGVTPVQWALADFMEAQPEFCDGLAAFYQAKRDHFLGAMQGGRFRLRAAAGTYFQLADYSAVDDREDRAMAEYLTTEVGVAAIPISVFYSEPPAMRYVRFCFAKQDATLGRAAQILAGI